MKKSVIFRMGASICIIALMVCAAMIFRNETGIGYADAGQYTAGGATLDAAVENLDIHWVDGSVTIAYHEKDTVEISEKAPKAISDKDALRWLLDGDTLRIQYAKPGFSTTLNLKKELTVTLPKDITLDRVCVEAASADVIIPALHADVIETVLTSGDLSLEQAGSASRISMTGTAGTVLAMLEDAKEVYVTSTSGKIDLLQNGSADSVRMTCTSGIVRADLGNAGTVDVTTTSGPIKLEAKSTGKVKIGSTSGGITAELSSFDSVEAKSTSGNVNLTLPSKPGFRADISTASGSFNSGIALKQDGKSYSCGDESASVRINTTSGDIRLSQAKGK